MSDLPETAAIEIGKSFWWTEAWAAARPPFVAVAKEMISTAQILVFLAIF